ncbi:MAG: hypothetical protein GWP59_01875 [Chlamydiales bacterium]|nr:hypothetical protein [Chlamydiales bacterium]NCF70427.1 hypothetical protein [Chlamydiales bacterium]
MVREASGADGSISPQSPLSNATVSSGQLTPTEKTTASLFAASRGKTPATALLNFSTGEVLSASSLDQRQVTCSLIFNKLFTSRREVRGRLEAICKGFSTAVEKKLAEGVNVNYTEIEKAREALSLFENIEQALVGLERFPLDNIGAKKAYNFDGDFFSELQAGLENFFTLSGNLKTDIGEASEEAYQEQTSKIEQLGVSSSSRSASLKIMQFIRDILAEESGRDS